MNEYYEKQKQFCKEKDLIFFAPKTCWKCGNSVFNHLQAKEDSDKKFITGCPYCGKSFVE